PRELNTADLPTCQRRRHPQLSGERAAAAGEGPTAIRFTGEHLARRTPPPHGQGGIRSAEALRRLAGPGLTLPARPAARFSSATAPPPCPLRAWHPPGHTVSPLD